MNYIIFKANEKEYKLKLSTRRVVELEKSLKCNPIAIFGTGETIPEVSTMIDILHHSLQELNHGISMNDTYNIFDEWLSDGHVTTDFIPVIIDIYKASGIIRDTNEKN